MTATTDLAAARLASDTRKGTRDSGTNARLRAAALAAQDGRCAWCQRPLAASDAQLDRLASGRALDRCGCSGSCRCAYLPGNVVSAHRACHDPERGARRSLTEREEHALATAYAPTADAIATALRATRANVERVEDSAAALRAARAAAAALLT